MPELLEDGQPDGEGVGGVAEQEPVPEVEDLVEREHVAEHGEEPGDGVQVRNETFINRAEVKIHCLSFLVV